MRRLAGAAALLVLLAGGARAGEADVVAARAVPEPGGTWRFEVSVRHADTGWQHYADAWQVVAPDGTVLATRTLLHPHENEQPFTRSLSGVRLPPGTARVTIRAHDKVHGFGGREASIAVGR